MRVASLGFWHVHGDDYARDALAHPAVDLVAVWDEDPERAQAAAAQHGVPARGFDEILADPDIDGGIVCGPTTGHAEHVIPAARAGKHVFMEKVLATTLTDAERILQEVREAGVTLIVSMRRSDSGAVRQIARLVAEGAVGQVTAIHAQDGHPLALPDAEHPDGLLSADFLDPAPSGGGALMDLCHPVYIVQQILGRPAELAALTMAVTGRAVEDDAAVVMSYPSGAIATVQTSYVARAMPFEVTVHGTAGSILYSEPGIGALIFGMSHPEVQADGPDDRAALRVWTVTDEPRTWRDVPIDADRPTAFDQWVDLVGASARDEENLALALDLTAAVEAAYESASSGRRVAVAARQD